MILCGKIFNHRRNLGTHIYTRYQPSDFKNKGWVLPNYVFYDYYAVIYFFYPISYIDQIVLQSHF